MSLLLVYTDRHPYRENLDRLFHHLSGFWPIEHFQTVTGLGKRLKHPLETDSMGVFLISDDDMLAELSNLATQLDHIPLLIILTNTDPENFKMAHRLHPRVVLGSPADMKSLDQVIRHFVSQFINNVYQTSK